MIKLVNVNKYYNKSKNNEIHVLNNINIEIEDKGLICLLGPSGCGKTTLLNVIGGLDDFDSGELYYHDRLVVSKELDEIRINDVGFVFQNYVLFPDKTVYDNLRLVLNMYQLSESQIDERISYALKAVGMEKYKRRLASQLSGGQMQRIAIARGLVKSPNVIIADEPTGNLDEKNTTQIMNILKKLSNECLVILVTHERRLADFYGDRIVELLDGKITKDYVNSNRGSLTEKDETNIYLQDLEQSILEDSLMYIRYFYVEEKPKIKLDVVFKNDTFFIQGIPDNERYHIKYIEKDSDTLIIDDKKPDLKIEDIDDFDYHMPLLEKKDNVRSAISFKDTFKMAFDYLKKLRTRKKLFLLTFFLSSLLIVISLALFNKSVIYEEKDFLFADRNYYLVSDEKGISIEELKEIEDRYQTNIYPNNSLLLTTFTLDLFMQVNDRILSFPEHSLSNINNVNFKDLVCGRMPSNVNEVVIDRWIIDLMMSKTSITNDFVAAGGTKDYTRMLGMKIAPNLLKRELTIVGICDTNNPNIYVDMNIIYEFVATNFVVNNEISFDYDYFGNPWTYYTPKILLSTLPECGLTDYEGLDGQLHSINSLNLNDGQIIVNQTNWDYFQHVNSEMYSQGKYYFLGYENHVFDVVGITDEPLFVMNENTIKDTYFSYVSIIGEFVVDNYNTDDISDLLKEENFEIKSMYQYQKSKYQSEVRRTNIGLLLFTSIILTSALVFLYFTMRTSLISRIYEVGVYRALGIKKFDIYKIFISEISLISLFTCLPGYIFGSYLVLNQQSSFISLTYYPWYSAIFSFIFICLINYIIGLIPVANLMRNTPAEILSKYDI